MGSYITIYRWDSENLMAFGKKWYALAMGAVPKELQAALTKFKNLQIFYSLFNSCIVAIYDLDDGDMIEANMIALHLADTCKIETFPVLSSDDYGKSTEMYLKIFPDLIK